MTFQLHGYDVLLVKVYENRYIMSIHIINFQGDREMSQPVLIKGVKSGMVLRLDSEMYFDELLPLITEKFEASASFFGNAKVVLSIEGRDGEIRVYYKPCKRNLDVLKDIITL